MSFLSTNVATLAVTECHYFLKENFKIEKSIMNSIILLILYMKYRILNIRNKYRKNVLTLVLKMVVSYKKQKEK